MTIPTTPGTHARARTPIAATIRRIAAIGTADNGGFGNRVPLREGTPVWLSMCYVNKAGDWVQCSDWQRATA